jgi:hypothetical protein
MFLRTTLLVAFIAILPRTVSAGPPDPSRCTIETNASPVSCQFRFRSDGGLDELRVHVVIRNAFDIPSPNCPTRATLQSAGATTLALCACTTCGIQTASTNINGEAEFIFRKIGGRGELQVLIETLCFGTIPIGSVTIPFTSPDLDGSGSGPNPTVIPPCKAAPLSATDVIDLGIWANGLPPNYEMHSDYDCSGAPLTVVDLAIWAGGLGQGCVPGCP